MLAMAVPGTVLQGVGYIRGFSSGVMHLQGLYGTGLWCVFVVRFFYRNTFGSALRQIDKNQLKRVTYDMDR